MKCALLSLVVLAHGVQLAQAQQTTACRVLCTPEFKVEPTITFTNLFGSPRTIADDGTLTPERRRTKFELILSLGVPTRLTWLDFTVEAIVLPFDADSTPELEFETNFVWLPAQRTAPLLRLTRLRKPHPMNPHYSEALEAPGTTVSASVPPWVRARDLGRGRIGDGFWASPAPRRTGSDARSRATHRDAAPRRCRRGR